MLYCIGNRDQGICKIGYTADSSATKRLKSIQTGNPHPLVIFGVIENGEPQDESQLHDKFRGHRMLGEWFALTQEIADYFSFPLEPVERLWVVALTYMRKDVWETVYTNGMIPVFAPSEQEAIGAAKAQANYKGGCVRAQAMAPSRFILEKALALMNAPDFVDFLTAPTPTNDRC